MKHLTFPTSFKIMFQCIRKLTVEFLATASRLKIERLALLVSQAFVSAIN
jgi:hypothetical protein